MVVPDEHGMQLMAYLDGEMSPDERVHFERVLMQTPELQEDLAQFRRLQSLVQRVRIPEPKPELWDECPRHIPQKLLRGIGWILFMLGAVLVAVTSEYLLWSSNGMPWGLKAGITLMVLGLGVLLGAVILRRRKESRTDRYKEIVR